jgi:hypothetical protein
MARDDFASCSSRTEQEVSNDRLSGCLRCSPKDDSFSTVDQTVEFSAFSKDCTASERASSEPIVGATEGALSWTDISRLFTLATSFSCALGLVLPDSPVVSI